MAVLPTPASPIKTGLFLVRRDSIWTTRSISVSRPMIGSELSGASHGGEVDAELVERRRAHGALAGGGALLPALRLRLVEDALRLVAHALKVDAEAFQDARGDAFALADESEQQVLGTDVGVGESTCLVDRQVRSPSWHAGVSPISPLDVRSPRPMMNSTAERTLLSSTPRFDSTLAATPSPSRTRPSSKCSVADVVVVEALRLFLGERQHAACSFGEFVEPVSHGRLRPCTPTCARSRLTQHLLGS